MPPTDSNPLSRVLYNSRRTVDELIEKMKKTGNMESFTFGQKRDPCQSLFQKIMATFTPSPDADSGPPDGHNIGVTMSVNLPGLPLPASHSNHSRGASASGITTLINKTDANRFQYLDPDTLEPIGLASQKVLHPELKGVLAAAHAKTDPKTGDVFNYNLDIGSKSTYRVFRASASTQKTSILATITDAPAAYLHSLFLTSNYVILCVWGSLYSLGGAKMLYTHNVLDAISPLDPSKPCRWYVIDRSTTEKGVVATYTSPTFFSFHTINAYEEESSTSPGKTDIVADLTCYDDPSVLKRFYYDNLMSSSPGALEYNTDTSKGKAARPWLARYRLSNIPSQTDTYPAKRSTKEREAIRDFVAPRDQSVELPLINPCFVTKPHRYIYGVTDRGNSTFFDGLAKFDVQTQNAVFWSEQGQSAGEPIFVPNPNGTQEDDGVLLSVVLDGFREKSYLLCLDTRNMKVMGRADMEGRVGFGFHGIHVRAKVEGRSVSALDV